MENAHTADDRSKAHDADEKPPPLMALNHVTRLCKSVKESLEFYEKVLGFVVIERPQAFDFDGAWLFNYGVGVHLAQVKDSGTSPTTDPNHLDPLDNHISFQCEDMEDMERRLKEHGVKYMKRTVGGEENDTTIDQLFFKDPDGFMIEICNCENLTLIPSGPLDNIKLPQDRHNPPVELGDHRHGSRDDHRVVEEAMENDHRHCNSSSTPVAN